MAKTEVLKNKVFINIAKESGNVKATLRFLKTVKVGDKLVIKGAIDTKRKKGDVWETARAQFTCWQPVLRSADESGGFVDVEVDENASYDVELAGVAITATAFIDKSGAAQANQSVEVGLKPTITKTFVFDGSKADATNASTGADQDDDIPF